MDEYYWMLDDLTIVMNGLKLVSLQSSSLIDPLILPNSISKNSLITLKTG